MTLDRNELILHPTKDGSFTFFSSEFNEAFHSNYGAKQESYQKFVIPTQVQQVAKQGQVRILDVCYGLGYNTAAALEVIWQKNPHCLVEVIGLEINPEVPKAAVNQDIFNGWNDEYIKILTALAFKHNYQSDRLQAKLLIGDARKTIQKVRESGFLADAIFLDPFSHPQCPQLWTIEFIQNLILCLHENGLLATYSCAASVRTALVNAGLVIGSTTPVGRRTPGTIAAYPKHREKEIIDTYPLSPAEIEHLQTRAAVPYRDPQLSDTAEIIVMRRQKEQQASALEITSQWKKRWN
ncbi:MnmC family methyltransferase [Okeanomitos corallinicola TIOX110]|uniref:MnmC family methyltransferase n=1 Tax=Okeanomitos corallinicola TIOX110 TaxID=3133117 RepID=A0ABZ2USL3_9CYAN